MSSISIVICCYNSSNRLPETLKHLALQKLKTVDCEIVLVDNNSTDSTSETAKSEWQKLGSPFPLTVLAETKPGLSNARKTGVLASKNEYVCFCDDDNWLCNAYLETASEIMNSNPEIGVLAGQGIAVSNVEIPNWFYTYYSAFACGVLVLHSGDITHKQWMWGAGMVLRKSVIARLYEAGFKHRTLDKEGEKLTGCGDTEICYWHILVNYKLWYDERLLFKHYMPESRLTKERANALFNGTKESGLKINVYKKLILIRDKKKTLAGFLSALLHFLTGNKESARILMYLPLLVPEEKIFIKDMKQSIVDFRKRKKPI